MAGQDWLGWVAAASLLATSLSVLWGIRLRRSLRERTSELRLSEGRFKKAFHASSDGQSLTRASDSVLMDVNQAFLTLSGYSRGEVLGRSSLDLGVWLDPADRDAFRAAMINAGIVRNQPICFRDATGASRDGLVSGEFVQVDGVAMALTSIRDVTEMNRIQQRLLSVYDTVADAIVLIAVEEDGGFRFESVNKRLAEITGMSPEFVVGKRVEDLIPAALLSVTLGHYRQAIEEKRLIRWEQTSDYPSGRLTGEMSVAPIIEPAGKCTHLVLVVHDVTDRKAAEERQERTDEQLRQSQKLEGIGRLAGGVAHDFNNILGVILGYGDLMRKQIPEGHPARPRLEQVIKSAHRAAALTRQLLAFSRKQMLQPKLLDLGAVVHDLTPMLERVVGEDMEIEVRAAAELGAVSADPTQVEQVILNLVVNARDAMPKGGQLTIETANVEFDDAYVAAHPTALAGRFVMVAVSDNGVGMDAETQKHMFEPFFTTKPLGEGTGLGLATLYGIVKQTGGHVWVYSEVGRGTTFKVYLPRVIDAAAEPPTPVPRPAQGGVETVLVVEDAEGLRELIRELLEERGYTVLSANDGQSALALVQGRVEAIDLLLTDVVMPKLGGGDLVKQVRALRPGLRVLYMSGYTAGVVTRQGVLDAGDRMLDKPFTDEQLSRAVRQALDAPVLAYATGA